jgi:hypothetical protein
VRKNIRQVRRGGAVRFEIHVEHVRQHGALVNAPGRAVSVGVPQCQQLAMLAPELLQQSFIAGLARISRKQDVVLFGDVRFEGGTELFRAVPDQLAEISGVDSEIGELPAQGSSSACSAERRSRIVAKVATAPSMAAPPVSRVHA